MDNNFTIVAGCNHVFAFDVQILYRSEQVIRFFLISGHAEMTLEKRLLTKTQPWKILSMNFIIESGYELNLIFKELDLVIKPAPLPYIHPKNN